MYNISNFKAISNIDILIILCLGTSLKNLKQKHNLWSGHLRPLGNPEILKIRMLHDFKISTLLIFKILKKMGRVFFF